MNNLNATVGISVTKGSFALRSWTEVEILTLMEQSKIYYVIPTQIEGNSLWFVMILPHA